MDIGERLKILRKSKGLTLEELAKKMGMKTKFQLSVIENGKTIPSLGMLKRYSNALGLEIEINFVNMEDVSETLKLDISNSKIDNRFK